MHHHIAPVGTPIADSFLPDNPQAFWERVQEHNVLGILYGHTHMTLEAEKYGIPLLGLRSTAPQFVPQQETLMCIQPLHYRLVTLQDTSLLTRIVEVPL